MTEPDPTQPLSTDPNDFCFIDTETRSHKNVKTCGMYEHTAHCRVLIVTYAIGDGPVQRWVNEDWHEGARLDWRDAPEDLLAHMRRASNFEAWFVAWNAAFDRHALTWGLDPVDALDVPLIPDIFIDAMTQATRSHLPPDLRGASARAGGAQKGDGKKGILLFADEAGTATPETHPQEWADFIDYAVDDIASMRDVFWSTLPLSRREWEEYWASEQINDRGLPIDVPFVRAASELAELAAEKANADVARISGGALYSVNQHEAIGAWVADRLALLPEAERIMTREIVEEPDDEGDLVRLPKLSLERNRVEELIAYLDRVDAEQGLTDDEWAAYEMLQVRLYGASATPRKFTKMLPLLGDGTRLRGQYVFAGAPATGRFSSRGLQVHNLTRKTVGELDDELDAIEMVTSGWSCSDRYADLQYRFGPVGRTLSRLIRPAIVAPPGYQLAWIDWSAIEARVLPWLAGSARADEEVLEVFRVSDRDPALPDIYRIQAGKILGIPALEITKPQRQSHGKVPVLSLGFGGGNGALFNMARNYGASFTETEATTVVQNWREANKWARAFWDALWEAALHCMQNPGAVMEAGRITVTYMPDYMHGTLVLVLPCGRPLLYPVLRWEERELKNKLTGVIERKVGLTYRRGYGRAGLWYGTLAENVTQGFAATLLRRALWVLDEEAPQLVVGHTHDEVILMAREADIAASTKLALDVMLDVPSYAAGLPLAAAATIGDYYTKTGD